MNKGQGQPGQHDGLSLSITISKNEVNPITNNKVIQINRKKMSKNWGIWPWMSRSFMNEGQG